MLQVSIFADYSHFYIQDEGDANANVLPCDWDDAAVKRMLAVTSPGAVGVGTARAESVPVTVRVDVGPPPVDPTAQLVTEAGLQVPSGRIVIMGPTGYLPDATRLDLPPGAYGVRIFYRGLDTISPDGFDGNDSYELVLWPSSPPPAPSVVADRRA